MEILYNVGPRCTIVNLMDMTPISVWFMVLITIVPGFYNASYNCKAPDSRVVSAHGY